MIDTDNSALQEDIWESRSEAEQGYPISSAVDTGQMLQLELKLPMRDGKCLATTIFFPRCGEGPWTVLLERTPYGRLGARTGEQGLAQSRAPLAREVAAGFCQHGFAVAVQDCRGRYDSEGTFEKYTNEAQDSFDTIEAISAAEWCDGRVVTYGQSYSALVQTSVGPLAPSSLAAQIIDSGGFTNAWRNGLRQNGVVEMKQAIWLIREAAESQAALQDPDLKQALLSEDVSSWLDKMPWSVGHSPLAAHPEYERQLLKLFEPDRNEVYWSSTALATEEYYEDYSRIPIQFLSSWYDPYARTISEMFCGLRDRQQCSIILGPWVHCEPNNPIAGDVDFGLAACLDSWTGSYIDYRHRFITAALKGAPFDEPPVQVFLMGGGSGRKTSDGHLDHGGKWLTAKDWPMPGTVRELMYFAQGGELVRTAPSCAQETSFHAVTAEPVPTIGGDFTSFAPYLAAGAFNQVQPEDLNHCREPGQLLSDRTDVAVFRTAPLEKDLVVAGPVDYEIAVTIDAADGDVTVKLIDEYPSNCDYPDGYAMLLGDTIQRLSHVEGGKCHIAGRKFLLKGTLCWTANRFVAGHRLRVDISSSNFPKFERRHNAQTKTAPSQNTRYQLFLGGETGGCRIYLPTLPEGYQA